AVAADTYPIHHSGDQHRYFPVTAGNEDLRMTEYNLGVHSETGTLRQVIVCRPGLAHRRLTPSNCDALLFDDVFWVKQAQKDHDVFVELMRARGVEVLDVNELLAETLDIDEARAWILDNRITWNHVGM